MNLWKQYQSLTVTGPRFIGEVTAVATAYGETRATLDLTPGGAELEVTATGQAVSVGQKWIVQDGKILEPAPSGAVVNVVI